jgi:hypothetical protein
LKTVQDRSTVHFRRVWVRWLRSRGLSDPHVAAVLRCDLETIESDARFDRDHPQNAPTSPPLKCAGRDPYRRPILGHTGRHVRTLHALAYPAARVAELLALDPERVRDFIKRITPLRAGRQDPNRLTRPRTAAEDRAAKRQRKLADDRRRRRAEERAALDAWGPRGAASDVRSTAPRTSVPMGTEAPELVAGVPAIAVTPPPNPWVGAVVLHARGCISLSPAQIAEAWALLQSGATWVHVAGRLGCSENTLRRYVKDVAPRRAAARYPAEATRYVHGVVRWDLPLEIAGDGTHRTVLVECQCGRGRRVWTCQVTRPKTRFTGMCDPCYRHGRAQPGAPASSTGQ